LPFLGGQLFQFDLTNSKISKIHCSRAICTYSVDVADGGGGEVVVDDHVDAFEVDASSQQLRANQNPHFALSE
jgi:hypothetical protein